MDSDIRPLMADEFIELLNAIRSGAIICVPSEPVGWKLVPVGGTLDMTIAAAKRVGYGKHSGGPSIDDVASAIIDAIAAAPLYSAKKQEKP